MLQFFSNLYWMVFFSELFYGFSWTFFPRICFRVNFFCSSVHLILGLLFFAFNTYSSVSSLSFSTGSLFFAIFLTKAFLDFLFWVVLSETSIAFQKRKKRAFLPLCDFFIVKFTLSIINLLKFAIFSTFSGSFGCFSSISIVFSKRWKNWFKLNFQIFLFKFIFLNKMYQPVQTLSTSESSLSGSQYFLLFLVFFSDLFLEPESKMFSL